MIKCEGCGHEFQEDLETLRKTRQLGVYKDFEDGSIELVRCGHCPPLTESEKKEGIGCMVKKLFGLDQAEKDGDVEVKIVDAKDMPN